MNIQQEIKHWRTIMASAKIQYDLAESRIKELTDGSGKPESKRSKQRAVSEAVIADAALKARMRRRGKVKPAG